MHTFTDFWRKSDLTLSIVPYQCLDLCLPLASKGTPFTRLEPDRKLISVLPILNYVKITDDLQHLLIVPFPLVCAATFCALFSASFQLPPFICLCSAAVFGQTGKPIIQASCFISAGEETAAADVYFHTFMTLNRI